MDNQILYYITGPIGVGKSSLVKYFVNEFVSSDIEYICADQYFFKYFQNCIDSVHDNYGKAKMYRDYKISKHVQKKRSFIWESVFDEEKIRFLQQCKKKGYFLFGLYVGIDSIDILTDRVSSRKMDGWYDVPFDKIMDRYQSMMKSLLMLYQLTRDMIMIDTSGINNKLVCYKRNKKLKYYDDSCNWLYEYLPKAQL